MSALAVPACSTWPKLFDSIELEDYREARQRCVGCDYAQLCRDIALDPASEATGTFAGDLYRDGQMIMSCLDGDLR